MFRVYRFLLRFYPRSFRNEYGEEMLQLFRDRMRDEDSWLVWRDVMSELFTALPREHWRARNWNVGVAVVALAVTLVVLWSIAPHGRPFAYLPLADLPSEIDGRTRQSDFPVTESVYSALGTRDVLNRVYSGGRQPVSLFVARWPSNGFVTPVSPSDLDGWKIVRQEPKLISVGEGVSVHAASATLVRGDDSALVLYWYQTRQVTSADDPLWGRLVSKLGFTVHRRDVAIIRVSLKGGESDPETAASRFVQGIYPELAKRL